MKSKVEIAGNDITFNIERLLINEATFEDYDLINIEHSKPFSFSDPIFDEPLNLPRLYAGLRFCYGPGEVIDDKYKSAYQFTFELNVTKNEKTSKYAYKIYQYRSYIELMIVQMVPKTVHGKSISSQKPNDELFSNQDIDYVHRYFCSYVLSILETSGHCPKPFLKSAQSNLLLFGYYQDDYLVECFEDEETFRSREEKLSKAIFDERMMRDDHDKF